MGRGPLTLDMPLTRTPELWIPGGSLDLFLGKFLTAAPGCALHYPGALNPSPAPPPSLPSWS